MKKTTKLTKAAHKRRQTRNGPSLEIVKPFHTDYDQNGKVFKTDIHDPFCNKKGKH